MLFFVGILLAASGLIGPPLALSFGLAFGLALKHPYPGQAHRLSRFLLQVSVVCLGFGMNLHEVIRAGRSGFAYTALGITFALTLGTFLGKIFRVPRTQSLLISAGTAICGGSAVAALGPVLDANEEEMAVSLGTVFVLNSAALIVFPAIGWSLHMTQTQFGLWAALAIHDTSSVVGAGAKYGPVALAVGTTVKLARALWIIPVALATASLRRSNARMQWPWFIAWFCLAALAASYLSLYLPPAKLALQAMVRLGHSGLTVVLFLIGTGISRNTLRQVGLRPLLQGILLWITIASLSLWAIHTGRISL